MKKNLLIVATLILVALQSQAQCNIFGSGFGNNTAVAMYNVAGNVQVVLNTNNTVTVNLMSNFATAAGPDVRIYLVDRGTLTTAQLRMTSNFLARPRIEMGISPASGATSFTKPIPSGMNIMNFNTIYFYCNAFNQFWDFGSYTPFTTANCAVLGTSVLEKSNFKLFPNPVNNVLNIELNETSDILDAKIYNTLGALVFSQKEINENNKELDVSLLDSGVYFIELQDKENNRVVKRFVKQ
jgi:Secretion system C-terminal sorting domain/Electron transfer DM13